MAVINGTFNQVVKASKNLGGSKVVFEGHPSLLVGGFYFTLTDLPAPGEVLPCGTPVNCDEATRAITPVITAAVSAVSTTTVTLADNGGAFKVGDTVAELPADLSTAATNYATIAAISGNTVTLSAAITGLAANDVLVVVDATTKKVKAVPNALLPYDVVRDENAISVDGDGMWANDRPILERRMPPVNAAIKAALVAAGCQFKWSNRK